MYSLKKIVLLSSEINDESIDFFNQKNDLWSHFLYKNQGKGKYTALYWMIIMINFQSNKKSFITKKRIS